MNDVDSLSESDLAAIEERAAAASPGPWAAFVEGRDHLAGDSFIRVGEDDAEPDMYVSRNVAPAAPADLDFIAAARQDIPRLVREIQRLRGRDTGHPAG